VICLQVKVLYVRHLREAVTEEQLKELFGAHGEVERAKKIRDYAFIHFADRESALKVVDSVPRSFQTQWFIVSDQIVFIHKCDKH
jgi:RNA recognition motif-containing protein